MTCTAKHIKPEPDKDLWCCPRCGATPEDEQNGFYIDNFDPEASRGCELTHVDDFLRCYPCGYECSGAEFSRQINRKANLVRCPHCKGAGFVKGPTKRRPKK